MKAAVINSSQLMQDNLWLTGTFYLSDVELYRSCLARFPISLLQEVVARPPFCGSRVQRIYVADPNYGIPYLSNTDMMSANPLERCKYISRKMFIIPKDDRLQLGWLLVSGAGAIGLVKYVTEELVESIASSNIIVLAPASQILSGYLYTYLSSKVGVAFMRQFSSGRVQSDLDPGILCQLPIPRLDPSIEQRIHKLIEQAMALSKEANSLLGQAKEAIEREVDFFNPRQRSNHDFSAGLASIDTEFGRRIDSFCYVGYIAQAVDTLKKYPGRKVSAPDVGYRIFNPPIFKRIFAKAGHPYMSGAEIYTSRPSTEKFLSVNQSEIEQYIVSKGMVLIQSAGQRYGLITTPVMVGVTLDGIAATSDIVRVIHPDIVENGYLCSLFASEFGRRLALRYSYGTSIPRLDVSRFSKILIPWPEDSLRRKIGSITVEAYSKRDSANDLEDQAQALLVKALGLET